MAALRSIPSHSKVRRCLLCGRTLLKAVTKKEYNNEVVWCRVCIARHVMGKPCPVCDGAIHLPDGGVWTGFGNV